MERKARRWVEKGKRTILFEEMARKGRDRLTSGVIEEALKQEDRMTERLIDDAVWALGVALLLVGFTACSSHADTTGWTTGPLPSRPPSELTIHAGELGGIAERCPGLLIVVIGQSPAGWARAAEALGLAATVTTRDSIGNSMEGLLAAGRAGLLAIDSGAGW